MPDEEDSKSGRRLQNTKGKGEMRNAKYEIRNTKAKFENGASCLCVGPVWWAILWVTRKSLNLMAVRLWLLGPAAEK